VVAQPPQLSKQEFRDELVRALLVECGHSIKASPVIPPYLRRDPALFFEGFEHVSSSASAGPVPAGEAAVPGALVGGPLQSAPAVGAVPPVALLGAPVGGPREDAPVGSDAPPAAEPGAPAGGHAADTPTADAAVRNFVRVPVPSMFSSASPGHRFMESSGGYLAGPL
jgi:hypothetical protein